MSSIEPYAVTTVQRRPLARSEAPCPLSEVQAPIRAIFGGRLPSMEELCKAERKGTGRFIVPVAPSQPTERQLSYRAEQAAKTAAIRSSIIQALTKPMTAGDISYAIKRDLHMVRRHLGIMHADGQVTGKRVNAVTIWQRVAE